MMIHMDQRIHTRTDNNTQRNLNGRAVQRTVQQQDAFEENTNQWKSARKENVRINHCFVSTLVHNPNPLPIFVNNGRISFIRLQKIPCHRQPLSRPVSRL